MRFFSNQHHDGGRPGDPSSAADGESSRPLRDLHRIVVGLLASSERNYYERRFRLASINLSVDPPLRHLRDDG
jgi:hypothetical protein